jgi:hypothetical protein
VLLLIAGFAVACGTPESPAPDAVGEGPALEHDEHDEDDGFPISPGADPQEPGGGTTETSWGEVWDRLSTGFPIFPGALPSDEAAPADEPVSGAFIIDGVMPDEVTEWMQAALEEATYSTEALSGPLDDGSYVIDSVGDGECRVETTITPTGADTTIAVRYGAGCPS